MTTETNRGMSITNIRVFGFEPAFRDLRNPKESWDRSDSKFYLDSPYNETVSAVEPWDSSRIGAPELPFIGPKDMKLALNLIVGGGAHRKFLREITVWWTITIPRALWQELDTYKVATVRNSCSTMHKLGSRDLTPQDFADEDVSPRVLDGLNEMGVAYRNKQPYTNFVTGRTYEGVPLLRHMKFRLPEGFLQRAGYVFNYETALKMWYDRKDHRMEEWSEPDCICDTIASLPYMKEFIEAMGKMRG